MISVETALQQIIENTPRLPARNQSVFDSLGMVLALDLPSPNPSPTFDKVLMDGYAVRSDDLHAPDMLLQVVGSVKAGDAPRGQITSGEAVLVMTGAPLPPGADAVVPRERTRTAARADDSSVPTRISIEGEVRAEDNVLRQGAVCAAGQIAVESGCTITPARLAFLVDLGVTSITVFLRPDVAVLATGDELVAADEPLRPGCIHNTNGPLLLALLQSEGIHGRDLGIGRDNYDELRERVREGLQSDLLILSGGVSVGDFDLVPRVLRDLEVVNVFHGVRMRPGKPLWFGVAASGCRVFGLPGNPLSTFVGFHVMVRAAIRCLTGHADASKLTTQVAVVTTELSVRTDREVFWPARTVSDESSSHGKTSSAPLQVEILPWLGSADLRTLAMATGFVRICNEVRLRPGDCVEYLSIS
jgi:molybdopterin molybdotransferase